MCLLKSSLHGTSKKILIEVTIRSPRLTDYGLRQTEAVGLVLSTTSLHQSNRLGNVVVSFGSR